MPTSPFGRAIVSAWNAAAVDVLRPPVTQDALELTPERNVTCFRACFALGATGHGQFGSNRANGWKSVDPPLEFDSPVVADPTLHYCAYYENGVGADGSVPVRTTTRRATARRGAGTASATPAC
jgi:hypothetical protein